MLAAFNKRSRVRLHGSMQTEFPHVPQLSLVYMRTDPVSGTQKMNMWKNLQI